MSHSFFPPSLTLCPQNSELARELDTLKRKYANVQGKLRDCDKSKQSLAEEKSELEARIAALEANSKRDHVIHLKTKVQICVCVCVCASLKFLTDSHAHRMSFSDAQMSSVDMNVLVVWHHLV